MKKHLVRILQFVVTIGALVWVFWDKDMRKDMLDALTRADITWIIIGVLVGGIGEISNIIRWGIFLRIQQVDISWKKISSVFMIGVFFNLFLMGTTGGDVVKLLYLVKEHKTKKSAVVLSLIADRLIGVVALIFFGIVVVAFRYEWLSATPKATSLLYALIIFLAGAGVVIFGSFLITGLHLIKRLPDHFPGRDKLISLSAAYNLFAHSWKESFVAFLLSFPVLFSYFGVFYCAGRAFQANVSLADIFSIMPIITIGVSLPISVGGLGVRESLFKDLLHDLVGTSGEVAVLISLAGMIIYIVWNLIGAVFYVLSHPSFDVSIAKLEEKASHPLMEQEYKNYSESSETSRD